MAKERMKYYYGQNICCNCNLGNEDESRWKDECYECPHRLKAKKEKSKGGNYET